jgi:hypothetical protein
MEKKMLIAWVAAGSCFACAFATQLAVSGQTAPSPIPASENKADSASAEDEAAAKRATVDWLILLDWEKYDKSWEQAGSIFKSKITQANWAATIRATRSRVGKLHERAFNSLDFTTTLRGCPPGEYFTVNYDAKFANEEHAAESLFVMKEKDGTWHVIGYRVGPNKR